MNQEKIILESGFKPEFHGFRFINTFKFPAPLKSIANLFNKTSNKVYGLCGGMCFATLDYFYANIPIPQQKQILENFSGLHRYLWSRQIATFAWLRVPIRIISWMLSSDKKVSVLTAEKELPKLLRNMKQKKPVVLALVREKGFHSPTHNHQVIATSCIYEQRSGNVTINIYDPNHSSLDQNHRITLNVSQPSIGIKIQQSTNEPLRGFFLIPYKHHKPI